MKISFSEEYINVGDTVLILYSRHISGLKHRKNHPVKGKVTSRSGFYIYVKPYHARFEIEAYDCELKKEIKNDKNHKRC